MKKIFSIVFLIFATTLYSQIKTYDTGELIGKIQDTEGLVAELRKKEELLTFMYRDVKYQDFIRYKIFVFKESDLDVIYDLFVNSERREKDESITVELETGDLLIFEYKRSLGIRYTEIFHQSNGVRELLPHITNRQTRKLFGKL